MDNKTTAAAILVLAGLGALFGITAYPLLPSQIPMHISLSGQVDSYGSSFEALLLFPWLLIGTFLIWYFIPRVEPMKKNFATFRHAYNGFFLILSIFIFYTFTLLIGLAMGWAFNFIQAFAPGIALLFASIAILLEHTRRNFLVGIRTPWTLSSDKVWKRTNLLGSKMFYMCAIWAFAGVVYPEYFGLYIFIPVASTVAITVIYSFVEYRRLER